MDNSFNDEIWNKLKQTFKEGLRMEEDEYRAVGLNLNFSYDATDMEVQDAGNIFAGRII